MKYQIIWSIHLQWFCQLAESSIATSTTLRRNFPPKLNRQNRRQRDVVIFATFHRRICRQSVNFFGDFRSCRQTVNFVGVRFKNLISFSSFFPSHSSRDSRWSGNTGKWTNSDCILRKTKCLQETNYSFKTYNIYCHTMYIKIVMAKNVSA